MKMKDNAIVTVSCKEKNFCADMELPILIPIERLVVELELTLTGLQPHLFRGTGQYTLFFRNTPLDGKNTLATSGVWSGSFLELRPIHTVPST